MTKGYLLDTNVVSELMNDAPAREVMAWFKHNAASPMYTSSVTQAEVLTGIALLPGGKRRNVLADAAQQMFREELAGRCLAFDGSAAQHYAIIRATRQRQGRPVTTEDAQIAAIAMANDLIIATRNTKNFQNINGLPVANPWQSRESTQ